MDCSPPDSSAHEDYPGKNTGVGCHALLQGTFPTQGSNSGLWHFRQILYHLNQQGSPRILQWVAYPFSRETSQPRNWTGVSCIAGRFFTSWVTRESLCSIDMYSIIRLHTFNLWYVMPIVSQFKKIKKFLVLWKRDMGLKDTIWPKRNITCDLSSHLFFWVSFFSFLIRIFEELIEDGKQWCKIQSLLRSHICVSNICILDLGSAVHSQPSIHALMHSLIHKIAIYFSLHASTMLSTADSRLKTRWFLIPWMWNPRKRQINLWLAII